MPPPTPNETSPDPWLSVSSVNVRVRITTLSAALPSRPSQPREPVYAPSTGLEGFDDFHDPEFRCTDAASWWKGAADKIEGVTTGRESTSDVANQVPDAGVSLGDEFRAAVDAPRNARAANVVANEINDHCELRAVFPRPLELFSGSRSSVVVAPREAVPLMGLEITCPERLRSKKHSGLEETIVTPGSA